MGDELRLDFIHKALLEGFTIQSLRRMLKYDLGKDLERITQGENLEEVVFSVIDTAERDGWLQDLIDQAKEANPGNYFVSMLGGDGSSMQQNYGRQDDMGEIRIVLFGSQRGGTPGFIESTNSKLEDIDSRIQRIEIVVNERGTVPTSFSESVLFRLILSALGLAAVGSLIASILQAVSNGA